MASSLILAVVVAAAAAASDRDSAPAAVFQTTVESDSLGPLDKAVFDRLKQLGIEPAHRCSDGVFLRRVFLDAIGTLPTAREASDFLADSSPQKRAALIDRLLARKEFADYWAMKWGDVLRVKAEFPINLWPNAVQAYARWIHTSLKENKPYDRFARELLTSSGSNFRVAPVNFYRALQSKEPQAIAQAVALTFMGERAERWPKERLAGMAAFFSQIGYKETLEWKEEIVIFDLAKAAQAAEGKSPPEAVFPDGTRVRLSPDRDPREVFADWLLSPKNPWFAKNIVNRIWYWLLGRGIVHEPDDLRPDNPPSNPELLARLEGELAAARYDLKQIYRLILNSETYQRSSVPRSKHPEAAANFASYPLRRLEAEVLIDALCQLSGTTEKYSSIIPEPFTFVPEKQRTIALADGSISSGFLEMFGRPSRDTGLVAERNNRPSAEQRLHFLNSSHVQRKIEQGPKFQALLIPKGDLAQSATDLYLTIVSRRPTDKELQVLAKYSKSGVAKDREVLVDLAWSLINSAEFLYRH